MPWNHHLIRLILYAAGCLLFISACQTPPAEDDTANKSVFIDDLGNSVAFRSDTIRIVPLAPSITEVLYLIEAGPMVAGVSQVDNYPPAVESLPRFSSWPLDIESIVALNPSLVIATTQVNNPQDTQPLEDLGIPVAYFKFSSFNDIDRVGRLLAEAFAFSDSSLTQMERLVQNMAALTERTRLAPTKPRVLVLVGDNPLYSFGKESYIHTIVEAAGGESITRDLDLTGPILTDEFVLEAQPEIIVGPFGSNYSSKELLALHPSWDLVPAIKNNRVYAIEADYILRPGPRLYDGALSLARLIHPSLFSDS